MTLAEYATLFVVVYNHSNVRSAKPIQRAARCTIVLLNESNKNLENAIKNPLENLPLNTKRVYVRGVCLTGCEVYMPVDSFDDAEQKRKKDELQAWLDKDYEFTPPKAA
jgi:hypothetical protein